MISQNISYKSATVLSPIGSFLLQKPEEKIQRSADKLIFVNRYSNEVKAEKIGVFTCSFDEVSQEVLRSSFHF